MKKGSWRHWFLLRAYGEGGIRTRNQGNDSKDLQQSIAQKSKKSIEKQVENDPELAQVIATWPNLPTAIRAGIMAIVNAITTGKWSPKKAGINTLKG